MVFLRDAARPGVALAKTQVSALQSLGAKSNAGCKFKEPAFTVEEQDGGGIHFNLAVT